MEVKVSENGPYVVTGGVPLVRIEKVETEQREPVDWSVTEEVEASETYALCRCGHSDNKPFCSGKHSEVGFDGTEAAPTDTYEERAKELGGTEVAVLDDRGICSHAGFCANRLTNVWKAAPQIDDDPELRQQIVEMVGRCPSGALTLKMQGQPSEPEREVRVAVQKDGPLLVTGGIPVQRADGEGFEVRNRVALCRCGHSENKPLCDGSHKEAGFVG